MKVKVMNNVSSTSTSVETILDDFINEFAPKNIVNVTVTGGLIIVFYN